MGEEQTPVLIPTEVDPTSHDIDNNKEEQQQDAQVEQVKAEKEHESSSNEEVTENIDLDNIEVPSQEEQTPVLIPTEVDPTSHDIDNNKEEQQQDAQFEQVKAEKEHESSSNE